MNRGVAHGPGVVCVIFGVSRHTHYWMSMDNGRLVVIRRLYKENQRGRSWAVVPHGEEKLHAMSNGKPVRSTMVSIHQQYLLPIGTEGDKIGQLPEIKRSGRIRKYQ